MTSDTPIAELNMNTLRDAVLALPSDERAELLDAVLLSLPIEAELEAWTEEIERRVEELAEGRVEGIPAERVFAEARERLRGRS